MALKTSDQYVERLKKMKPNIYAQGKQMTRDDPLLEKPINVLKLTFDLAQDPEYRDLMVTKSHLTGEPISRFTSLNLSIEDLYKQQEMKRKLCHKVGGCIQRCMATDTLNAMGVVTKEIDDSKGTDYHAHFLEFLKYYQANDLVGSTSQTDPKGDRSSGLINKRILICTYVSSKRIRRGLWSGALRITSPWGLMWTNI